MLRPDTFRMELDPVDWQLAMLQSHDCTIFQLGRDFEAIGQGFAFDDQGMIAGCIERGGQSGEQAFAAMFHDAHFAVHDLMTAYNIAAKGFSDGLMT